MRDGTMDDLQLRTYMPEKFDAEVAFLEHLRWIDKISFLVCRRHGLWDADAEDFAAWAKMRMIEDDYAILRKFRGESQLKTYLAAVVSHQIHAYMRERRGQWRPSAAAQRHGSPAVELETLVRRDGYSLAQAGERLRTANRTGMSDIELARLLAALPERAPIRPIEVYADAVWESATDFNSADARVMASEQERWRAELSAALERAMERLAHDDKMIVRLHYGYNHTIADVARTLRIEQKPLYRRIPQLRQILRGHLEGEGISAREVRAMLAGDEVTLWRRLEHDEFAQDDAGAIVSSDDLRDFDHPGILGPDGRPLTQEALEGSRIITDFINTKEQLLRIIRQNPSLMYTLPPRKFEEIVAEILDKLGYDISLTPESKDGGFDMYAAWKDGLGEFLYLVECKRYAPHNTVGVGLVRALHGVVEEKRASAGILVTTSHFTKEAHEFQRRLRHRLSLRDYVHLQEWLALTVPVTPEKH
jgi:RNA polymerase sigma factor (sigma-70 family)